MEYAWVLYFLLIVVVLIALYLVRDYCSCRATEEKFAVKIKNVSAVPAINTSGEVHIMPRDTILNAVMATRNSVDKLAMNIKSIPDRDSVNDHLEALLHHMQQKWVRLGGEYQLNILARMQSFTPSYMQSQQTLSDRGDATLEETRAMLDAISAGMRNYDSPITEMVHFGEFELLASRVREIATQIASKPPHDTLAGRHYDTAIGRRAAGGPKEIEVLVEPGVHSGVRRPSMMKLLTSSDGPEEDLLKLYTSKSHRYFARNAPKSAQGKITKE